MNVTVQIPDDIAARLSAAGCDLSRRALEGLALEGYRNGHINTAELRRLLGFNTSYEFDSFLQSHEGWFNYVTEGARRAAENNSSPPANELDSMFAKVRGLADDIDFSRNASGSRPLEL